MVHADDSQLISQAILGDADAFTELVRRYRNMVYGYCYYRTGSFEDARDISQETFVRAYTNLHQLREPGKLAAWLRRIAANECGRWSERKREMPMDSIEPPEPPRESRGVEIVRDALTSLPENERLAVVMHYVDGFSYAEIASFLEISKDAVRGRLHRGREALKSEVLKMTKDAFDENRLDEEFVVQSVTAALEESRAAFNNQGDMEAAWEKVNQAISLLDQVDCHDPKDPVALANAYIKLALREDCHCRIDQALDHFQRAKVLFEKAGDEDGLARWRWAVAYNRLCAGDLMSAYELYSQVRDHYLRQGGKSEYQLYTEFAETLGESMAAMHALESIGLDTDWDLVIYFILGTGTYKREDGQTLFCDGGHVTGMTKDGFPPRLATLPAPPRDLSQLPLVLIRNEPQVGDTLRFVTGIRSEESVLTSLTETVTTPSGIFSNCAHSSSRIFSLPDWTGDVTATRDLWIAPGVGVVRQVYHVSGEPADTTELAGFHVEARADDIIPLATGNWWRYRWVEGDEQHGLRTEYYKAIMAQSDDQFAAAQYQLFVKR